MIGFVASDPLIDCQRYSGQSDHLLALNIFKSFFRGLKSILQVLVGVGGCEEPGFVFGGGEINSFPEHPLEETGETGSRPPVGHPRSP